MEKKKDEKKVSRERFCFLNLHFLLLGGSLSDSMLLR